MTKTSSRMDFSLMIKISSTTDISINTKTSSRMDHLRPIPLVDWIFQLRLRLRMDISHMAKTSNQTDNSLISK